MSRVLNRYFLRETYFGTAAVMAILMMVYLVDRMARYLAEVAAGALPADVVLTLVGLKAVTVVSTLLPASFYLAILLSLGRMYSEGEMGALASAGIGPDRIIRYLATSAVPVALVTGLFALQIQPVAEQHLEQTKRTAERDAELSMLAAGRFSEARGGDLVYFIDALNADRTEMEGVFVRQRRAGQLTLIQAGSGSLTFDERSGSRELVLRDGTRYDGTPGSADYRVSRFGSYALRLNDHSPVRSGYFRLQAVPTSALFDGRWRGYRAERLGAELHWRLAAPVSVLLLALLAVPVSRTAPRQGRYGRLMVALLVYLIYSNLLVLARTLVIEGHVPVWTGFWWVHLLLAGLSVGLYRLQLRMRPLPRWRVSGGRAA